MTKRRAELWGKFRDFDYYRVSSHGRIRNRHTGKILSQHIDREGYYTVGLSRPSKKRKSFRVHTLVCETFRGPAPPKKECRHLNGVKTNNRLTNLKWGTRSQNTFDTIKHGRKTARGEQSGRAKLTLKQVLYIRENCIPYHRELGASAFAKKYGVTPTTIDHALKRINWNHV